MMEEIIREIISDGWYGAEIEEELKELPSICCNNDTFVKLIQDCHRSMKVNKDQDKLMSFFSSKIFPDVETLFPDSDSRFLNIIFIKLPAKLASCIKNESVEKSVNENVQPLTIALTEQEHGPLSYIIGAVVSKLYRKSKSYESPANIMLQNLLLSMRIPTEFNDYLLNLDRGGLWNPSELLVALITVVELIFREETSKNTTNIPTVTIINRSLESQDIISHWDAIVQNCCTEVNEECSSSCLENILKLFITIRSFSHTRNIVEKYRLLEKAEKKMKGLRKTLRNATAQK